MRKVVFNLLVIFCLATGLVAAAENQSGNIEKRDHVCMMQDNVMAKPGVAIEKDGKMYWGCCEMCKDKIASDPEKYTKAKDPVSGKTVDKADAYIYALKGTAFYFESNQTRKQFALDPVKYLKAMKTARQ